MARWINLHQNNIFVDWTRLPLLCEKSEAILLVLVGLTAAWQAGSLAGRQAVRQNKARFEKFWNLLLIALLGILRRLRRYSVIVVLPMHSSRFFRVKHIVRRVVETRKSGTPCFFVSILLKYYRT